LDQCGDLIGCDIQCEMAGVEDEDSGLQHAAETARRPEGLSYKACLLRRS
jgi:hypothetical protein